MTEKRLQKLMKIQMVPSYQGNLENWGMERKVRNKNIELFGSEWLQGKLISVLSICQLHSCPQCGFPSFQKIFNRFSSASFLQLWVSHWHLVFLEEKAKKAKPHFLDRHNVKKSAFDSKSLLRSRAKWWSPGIQQYQQALGLGWIMVLRMFQRLNS